MVEGGRGRCVWSGRAAGRRAAPDGDVAARYFTLNKKRRGGQRGGRRAGRSGGWCLAVDDLWSQLLSPCLCPLSSSRRLSSLLSLLYVTLQLTIRISSCCLLLFVSNFSYFSLCFVVVAVVVFTVIHDCALVTLVSDGGQWAVMCAATTPLLSVFVTKMSAADL